MPSNKQLVVKIFLRSTVAEYLLLIVDIKNHK